VVKSRDLPDHPQGSRGLYHARAIGARVPLACRSWVRGQSRLQRERYSFGLFLVPSHLSACLPGHARTHSPAFSDLASVMEACREKKKKKKKPERGQAGGEEV